MSEKFILNYGTIYEKKNLRRPFPFASLAWLNLQSLQLLFRKGFLSNAYYDIIEKL